MNGLRVFITSRRFSYLELAAVAVFADSVERGQYIAAIAALLITAAVQVAMEDYKP